MALQPIDRTKTKHAQKTSKRTVPQLVNRTNKLILPRHLLPAHKATAPRFGSSWQWRFMNGEDGCFL